MSPAAVKRVLKLAAQRLQRERRHAQHARMAQSLLGMIDQRNGALGSGVKRQARDYIRRHYLISPV